MQFVYGIVVYIWLAICLQQIAKKTSTSDDWLAWIPIVNLYLLCKIVGRSGWWIIAFLIPVLNVIVLIIWWWAMAEKRNKPGWLGVLMIIPVVNLIVPGILAFSE
ncbi:DUF5684 domain-containing protein [Chloroflexota bacterium]